MSLLPISTVLSFDLQMGQFSRRQRFNDSRLVIFFLLSLVLLPQIATKDVFFLKQISATQSDLTDHNPLLPAMNSPRWGGPTNSRPNWEPTLGWP